jgi:MGT family glycosyltransferase
MSARFLFVTWWGGGNVTPVVGLGTRLRHRGHEVRVLGPRVLASRFEGEGIDYRTQRGPDAWGDDVVGDLASEIEGERPDALVVDFMMPEALCVAEASGVPTAALVHTRYQPVLNGEMDLVGAFTTLDAVNATRESLALPRTPRMVELLDRTARVIVTLPRVFDDDATDLPANVRYVGAVMEEPGPDAGWQPPWPAGDGSPLVVASLGTTPMDEMSIIQRVLDALAELPVRALLTVGAHIDPRDLQVPANARVGGYVRHAAVLPHARMLVTHAGAGSVAAALTHGVPMVCVPLGREQPLNAARVVELGVGRALTPDAPVEALRAAIAGVLDDDAIASRARDVAARAADPADGAGDHPGIVELEHLAAAG